MNILNRRDFVLSSLATLAGSSRAAQPGDRFAIGLMADAQYADVAHHGSRHYRDSIKKLDQAVGLFNQSKLQFCVHLGDLIDRDWDSFSKPVTSLSTLRPPLFHILGNHDFSVSPSRIPEVPARLSMRKNYFESDIAGFRFIFLDTNDVSIYAHLPDSPNHRLATETLARIRKEKLSNAHPWNGAISAAQLKWLDAQCDQAKKTGLRVVIFAHHPVFPVGSHNVWNAPEALAVIDRHPNIVAWFNGHNHAGAYAIRNGVHFVTLHGMVETKNSNAFAVAEFGSGSIRIEGHGRESSRILQFADSP